jgi:hypothetical protein
MRNKSEDLKDEVYRQMFRLEESRAGAEISLALALLRAWLACGSKGENCEERTWLKTISPICLAMIEAALRAGGAAHSCSR